jgi:lambda family phage portal protein
MKLPRFIARWAYKIVNRYEGAYQSSGRSIIPVTRGGIRREMPQWTRESLVAKANHFEQNNPLVNRMADLFEAYTVGRGMVYQPASSDLKWNGLAKLEWDYWSKLPDLSSRHSLGTIESLAARTWFVQGECFIHLTSGSNGIPRIQIFEGHLVRTPPDLDADKSVVDGVRLDANGRPVSYFIGKEQHDGTVKDFVEKSADFIVHIFEPSRPGQVRGLPFVYPVVNVLHDLEDLQILEMRAARQAARIAILTKTETGEIDAEDYIRNGGVSVSTTDPERTSYYRESLGGEELVMKHGDSMEQFRSDRPSVVTMEAWRMMKSEACTGVGIPYVLVYPDSMQGTVYRGSLDMASAWFQSRHQVLADAFQRVYGYVMGVKQHTVPELRGAPKDYDAVNIHPPKSPNVDVGRNSQALLAEIAAGIKSPQGVIGADGRDWREVYQECAEAQKFADGLGLNLAVGAIPPTQQQDLVAAQPINRMGIIA